MEYDYDYDEDPDNVELQRLVHNFSLLQNSIDNFGVLTSENEKHFEYLQASLSKTKQYIAFITIMRYVKEIINDDLCSCMQLQDIDDLSSYEKELVNQLEIKKILYNFNYTNALKLRNIIIGRNDYIMSGGCFIIPYKLDGCSTPMSFQELRDKSFYIPEYIWELGYIGNYSKYQLDAEYRFRILCLNIEDRIRYILRDIPGINVAATKQRFNIVKDFEKIKKLDMDNVIWSTLQFGLEMRRYGVICEGISRTNSKCNCGNNLYHFYFVPHPIIGGMFKLLCLNRECRESEISLLAIFILMFPFDIIEYCLGYIFSEDIVNMILTYINVQYVKEWFVDFVEDETRNIYIKFNAHG